jgi:hypothetical protein
MNPKISTMFPSRYDTFSVGIQTGIQFHKTLNEKLIFYHGPAIAFLDNMNSNRSLNPSLPVKLQRNTYHSLTGKIRYIIAFQYQLAEQFSISAELSPYLFLTHHPTDNSNYYEFGLSTSNAGNISMIYRF